MTEVAAETTVPAAKIEGGEIDEGLVLTLLAAAGVAKIKVQEEATEEAIEEATALKNLESKLVEEKKKKLNKNLEVELELKEEEELKTETLTGLELGSGEGSLKDRLKKLLEAREAAEAAREAAEATAREAAEATARKAAEAAREAAEAAEAAEADKTKQIKLKKIQLQAVELQKKYTTGDNDISTLTSKIKELRAEIDNLIGQQAEQEVNEDIQNIVNNPEELAKKLIERQSLVREAIALEAGGSDDGASHQAKILKRVFAETAKDNGEILPKTKAALIIGKLAALTDEEISRIMSQISQKDRDALSRQLTGTGTEANELAEPLAKVVKSYKSEEGVKNLNNFEENNELNELNAVDAAIRKNEEARQAAWKEIHDLKSFLKFVKDWFNGKIDDNNIQEEFGGLEKNRVKSKEKKEKERKAIINNGIETLKRLNNPELQRSENLFLEVTGLKGLEDFDRKMKKRWWQRSAENTALVSMQKAYNNNCKKKTSLEEDNKKLKQEIDPFIGEKGFGGILEEIKKKGIHFKSTREEAKALLREIVSEFADEENQKLAEYLEDLKPEDKALFFKEYVQSKLKEEKYKNKSKSVKKLIGNAIREKISKPLDKIRVNDELIDKIENENNKILDKSDPIVQKKKAKQEYKKLKKKYENENQMDLKDVAGIISLGQAAKKNEESVKKIEEQLKEKKKELQEKRKRARKARDRINCSGGFRGLNRTVNQLDQSLYKFQKSRITRKKKDELNRRHSCSDELKTVLEHFSSSNTRIQVAEVGTKKKAGQSIGRGVS